MNRLKPFSVMYILLRVAARSLDFRPPFYHHDDGHASQGLLDGLLISCTESCSGLDRKGPIQVSIDARVCP